MSEESYFLPCLAAVVTELTNVQKSQMEKVIGDIGYFESLLKLNPDNSKNISLVNAQQKLDVSNFKVKTGSPNPGFSGTSRPKHFKTNSPVGKISQTNKYGAKNSEDTIQQVSTCRLDELLNNEIPLELRTFVESVDEYINLRQNPDKKVEVEKQSFLLELESTWAKEHKTLELFEPDIAETLFKYISVLKEKDKDKEPEIPDWPILGMMKSDDQVKEAESFFKESQAKICAALYEDLKNMDFDKLKLEENKLYLMNLYKLINILSDIKHMTPCVLFKKEPWQSEFLSD